MPAEFVPLDKTTLRQQARQQRQHLAQAALNAAPKLAAHFFAHFHKAATLAAYWPLSGEADCRAIMQQAHARGWRVALPIVLGHAMPLQFRQWQPDMVLTMGAHGILTPPATAPLLTPDIVLVPLLAFDAKLRRLGQGAGHYDATLAQLRAARPNMLAVGVALAAQQIAEVPTEAHDQPLDLTITEQSVLQRHS